MNNPLPPRQKEVLTLAASGAPYKCIADDLGISVEAVQRHMDNIRATLGIDSIAKLTHYALAKKMVKNEYAK